MRHPLATTLISKRLISPEQLEEVSGMEKTAGKSIWKLMIERGYLQEEHFLQALSEKLNMPIVSINGKEIAPLVIKSVPIDIVQKYKVIPIELNETGITLALSNNFDTSMLDEVRFATGRTVRPVLCPEDQILKAIEKYYDITVAKILEDMRSEAQEENGTDEYFIHDLQEKASEPTLINLVNLIITQAIQDEASDIHVETFENEMKIKYRIDGILHEIPPPPKNLQPAIVSRIKIMAGMDIAKRHVPQDGHIRINTPKAQVDIRVSTIPTVFGESVVMRLLNKSAMLYTLESLGLSDDNFTRFNLLLNLAYGIILVCGPTGSGKTTTLYAALSKIFTPEKKIITIEDPVEYQLNGINQIPVRPARGLSFASGLRSILRHDPDILMVGEIRDIETAEIAIRSALTGHLIFSTLHTNDAPGAITRLIDMGVEPYLIASSLQGVLAQRLVRKLCAHCRRPFHPDRSLLSQFGKMQSDVENIVFYQPNGCDKCKGRGYSGRTGIFELLLLNENLQKMILNREATHDIKATAIKGMKTMREDGWEKICRGITTFDEVLRQTQKDHIEDIDVEGIPAPD